MRAKEFITESVQEVTLNDLYHNNYPDRDELIWNFVGKNDFNIPFTVRKINPLDLEELIIDNYGVDDIQDLFKKMQPEQEAIISDYQNDPRLSQHTIILSGRRILDGNHRALAAVLANKPIKFIDVSEEQPERIDEVPLPPDWDKEQLNLRQTFKNRIKYAVSKAQRIGSGSSRVAFIIPYEGRNTVLKVAKNLKGLAQNEAEIQVLDDYVIGQSDIVIPLIDYDKDNKRPVWLQTELANQISMKSLLQLLRTPTLWFLTDAVNFRLGLPDKPKYLNKPADLKEKYFNLEMWISFGGTPTEQSFEIFNSYVDKLAELKDSSDIELGDLQDNSNWGQFMGRPVVIDLGLSSEIWQKMYKL